MLAINSYINYERSLGTFDMTVMKLGLVQLLELALNQSRSNYEPMS